MANLRLVLHDDDREDYFSTYKAASNIAIKIDQRFLQSISIACFCLSDGYATHLNKTMGDLQDILKKASDLIPERTMYYKLDPQELLMTVLEGAHNLGQLHAAWTALHGHLKVGLKMFEKYDKQYQSLTSPSSPASTAPEIYKTIKTLPI
jgi:hypothetical protein